MKGMIIMKKLIFGALLGVMMITSIASTNTISEAKDSGVVKLTEYNQKKSKKACKASKIKLYFDNDLQCMRVKSFKKSKYFKMSKKEFKKTLAVGADIFNTFYLDSKKYKMNDCSPVTYLAKPEGVMDCSISNIIKVAKPGIHTIKIQVGAGTENNRHSFWYTGKINIKKKTDWNTSKTKKQDITYNYVKNPKLFNVERVATNFNAKMEVNVKYIFDEAHYIKDSEVIENVKDKFNLKTDVDVYNFIYQRVGKDLTVTESVNVNKNSKKAGKSINIDISKNAALIKAEQDLYSYDYTFPSGYVYTEKVFYNNFSICNAFRPEVTVKFYDRENSEYVSEFTRTVKDVYITHTC